MKGIYHTSQSAEISVPRGSYTRTCLQAAKAMRDKNLLKEFIADVEVKFILRGIAMEPLGAEALHIMIRMTRAWTYGRFTDIRPKSAYLALLGVVYFNIEARYSRKKRTYVPPDDGMLILLLVTKLEREIKRFIVWERHEQVLVN